ncbi:MAG TPA: hypothetical protein VKD72_10865, partial [Gemmataceae bacterium]|nr:hypothetical protein [Gemmataceae bacterium]
ARQRLKYLAGACARSPSSKGLTPAGLTVERGTDTMRYQLWDCYYLGSGFAVAEQEKGLSYEQQNQILFGQRLAGPLPTVTITRLSRGKLPDLLGAAWTSYMVAPVFRDLLEEFCAEAVQFISVRIARRPRARYRIANILNSLPCFDPKRSEYTTHLHRPTRFTPSRSSS